MNTKDRLIKLLLDQANPDVEVDWDRVTTLLDQGNPNAEVDFEEVMDAMGLSSLQGLEFLKSVNAAFGQELTVGLFEAGEKVRVSGVTKGRGFQGVVKRYGFRGRPASHGHPMSRNPGSMGPGTDPSRVIKGKKLPGRMGGTRRTIRNLEVVRVDSERNLLFVRGGVPGSRNSYVLIRK